MSRPYKPLAWKDPHGLLAKGSRVFLYYARVIDDTGFEYRYLGKSKNGESRLNEYRRNIDKIFSGRPRRTTPGQEQYRTVHLALARACEKGWAYEFFPREEVPLEQINQIEQKRIAELECNLNGARSWLVQEYETVDLRALI